MSKFNALLHNGISSMHSAALLHQFLCKPVVEMTTQKQPVNRPFRPM